MKAINAGYFGRLKLPPVADCKIRAYWLFGSPTVSSKDRQDLAAKFSVQALACSPGTVQCSERAVAVIARSWRARRI